MMASDEPDPTFCDPLIYKNGVQVFVIQCVSSDALEWWVKQVAHRSKQPVDWHFIGGRAEVLALGDIKRVQEAIERSLPELELLGGVPLPLDRCSIEKR